MLAIMEFLWFYELFGLWVVFWLYGFSSLFIVAKSKGKKVDGLGRTATRSKVKHIAKYRCVLQMRCLPPLRQGIT